MKKRYRTPTSRSRRKPSRDLRGDVLSIQPRHGGGRSLQLSLHIPSVIASLGETVERVAGEAGLLVMKAIIDEEVEHLAGPRYGHDAERRASRWGSEESYLVFGGKKVPFRRPRVRSLEGDEVPLKRYALFQGDGRLQRAVANKVVHSVSMRNYSRVVDDVVDGYGIQRSSVSRQWKAVSEERLRELLERSLGDLDLAAVLIDGISFHEHMLVVALGIGSDGKKTILGLWQGATESAEVVKGLLDDLVQRGLDASRRVLFVLDGSKALAKAVRAHFGADALIQRCQIHKERNVLGHLPEKHHRFVRTRLRAAWSMRAYGEAKAALKKLVADLDELNPSAASSLSEGLEETIAINKLGIHEQLRQTLRSTNTIESCFADTRVRCRNVKSWKNGSMAQRWAGTMLLEAERRFRRVKGHQHLPHFMVSLKGAVARKEAVA